MLSRRYGVISLQTNQQTVDRLINNGTVSEAKRDDFWSSVALLFAVVSWLAVIFLI